MGMLWRPLQQFVTARQACMEGNASIWLLWKNGCAKMSISESEAKEGPGGHTSEAKEGSGEHTCGPAGSSGEAKEGSEARAEVRRRLLATGLVREDEPERLERLINATIAAEASTQQVVAKAKAGQQDSAMHLNRVAADPNGQKILAQRLAREEAAAKHTALKKARQETEAERRVHQSRKAASEKYYEKYKAERAKHAPGTFVDLRTLKKHCIEARDNLLTMIRYEGALQTALLDQQYFVPGQWSTVETIVEQLLETLKLTRVDLRTFNMLEMDGILERMVVGLSTLDTILEHCRQRYLIQRWPTEHIHNAQSDTNVMLRHFKWHYDILKPHADWRKVTSGLK